MNIAHNLLYLSYSDKKQLKKILSMYFKLKSLSESGNSDALVLKVDIDFMLKSENSPLNIKKRDVLFKYFCIGYTQLDLSVEYDITQEAISYLINSAIRDLVKYWGGFIE